MIVIYNINNKLDYLDELGKEQIWYIVKQEMEFWKVCYAVYILELFQEDESTDLNLETYFKNKANEINNEKHFDRFITTHRMLLLGYMYGLMIKNSNSYNTATLSEVYYKIKDKCNAEFEKTELYYDIIEQQVEKVYFSSSLDEKHDTDRENFRVYPLFLLYKVLLEIGNITGDYFISNTEFNVFVSTTEKYDHYLSTVYSILTTRADDSLNDRIGQLNSKFRQDNRYKRVLNNIVVLDLSEGIRVKDEFIKYVKEKVYMFEKSDFRALENQYLSRLCTNERLLTEENDDRSSVPMIDISTIEKNEIDRAIPRNMIIYGAPGTGKSKLLEKDYREQYFPHDHLYSRVTFNTNFSYSEFVGVYKPTPIYEKVNEKGILYSANKVDILEHQMIPHIDYTFTPGVFLEMLCRALVDSEHNYLLLIEEINRADVASVFGDIFQLLDRDVQGDSEYPIKLNEDAMNFLISKVGRENLSGGQIIIPKNLYIWATMNNADQNVTKMDTAFTRRWEFKHVGINNKEEIISNRKIYLKFLNTYISWNEFRKIINEYCSELLDIQEDRLIGAFFINDIYKDSKDMEIIKEDAFKYKLLLYLRDDVFRYNPSDLFVDNSTLGRIIEQYDEGKNIFTNTILEKLEKLVNLENDDQNA